MDTGNDCNQVPAADGLFMINDSGGLRLSVSTEDGGSGRKKQPRAAKMGEDGGIRQDLITSALAPANVEDMGAVVHGKPGEAPAAGIVFRSSQTPVDASSKVHFISNLTLIAKQPGQGAPVGHRNAPQNVIFLNNASPQKNNINATAANYINAIVPKANPQSKVSLLHTAGPSAGGGFRLQQKQAAKAAPQKRSEAHYGRTQPQLNLQKSIQLAASGMPKANNVGAAATTTHLKSARSTTGPTIVAKHHPPKIVSLQHGEVPAQKQKLLQCRPVTEEGLFGIVPTSQSIVVMSTANGMPRSIPKEAGSAVSLANSQCRVVFPTNAQANGRQVNTEEANAADLLSFQEQAVVHNVVPLETPAESSFTQKSQPVDTTLVPVADAVTSEESALRNSILHAFQQDHTYALPPSAEGTVDSSHSASGTVPGSSGPSAYQGDEDKLDNRELTIAMALAGASSRAAYQNATSTDTYAGQVVEDDNCSVISNDSRHALGPGEHDLGEETETAPEGDGEDDSVTRCICDLIHDDGYMICCDKCSTWQHVDCMGIDRTNIPEEYKCDQCQPRPMDRNRARTLQLLKRRDQQAALANAATLGLPLPPGQEPLDRWMPGLSGAPLSGGLPVAAAKPLSPAKKLKAPLGARRKNELGSMLTLKKHKRDLLKGTGAATSNGGRRKEKKTLSKKRHPNSAGVASFSGAGVAEDKNPVDQYEMAITNHYSPELRARLQALNKQQPALSVANSGLDAVGDLTNKCTTVPHAGGKILISTCDVAPNEPIVELRGRFMLSSQHPDTKPRGPFVFFYRISNGATELCVDTKSYGNDARFVRRSCRPNAELVQHLEKTTVHLYIVSLQPIRASTEITIKHEPHDLLAASRAAQICADDIPQPTSTTCACGLVTDCLFYSKNAKAAAPLIKDLPPLGNRRFNGKTRLGSGSSSSKEFEAGVPGRRRNMKGQIRNSRSTSSSGESSSISLMSPNSTLRPAGDCGTATQSPMQTTPSVDVPVPFQRTQSESEAPLDAVPTVERTEVSSEGPECMRQFNGEPAELVEEKPLDSSCELKEEEEEDVKDCDLVKTEGGSLESGLLGRSRNSSKELKSLSDESALGGGNGAQCEERKLTREERKMEAIMKAFEKMEKSSMRKQEGRKSSTSYASAEPLGKRSRSNSSTVSQGRKDPNDNESSIFKRKKRRTSKSYQQSTQRRMTRKKEHDDVFTSEESTGSLLASPPISIPYTKPEYTHHNKFLNGDQQSAVNMLLSLAHVATGQADTGAAADVQEQPAPQHHDHYSSMYRLVEAAIAPLDVAQDFKVPKTKKSIINEWLTTADKGGVAEEVKAEPVGEPETGDSDISQQQLDKSASLLHTPPPTGGSESAAKKRWLRQAISEECSDDGPLSPTNGFVSTPLKKRHFARHCSEQNEEAVVVPAPPQPPPVMDTSEERCSDQPLKQEADVKPIVEVLESFIKEEHSACAEEEIMPLQESLQVKMKHEQTEEPVPQRPPTPPSAPAPAPVISEMVAEEDHEEPQIKAEEPEEEPTPDDEPLAEEVPVKAEQVPVVAEEQPKPPQIIPEEFDIEPLNPGQSQDWLPGSSCDAPLDSSAGTSAEDCSDEIADIQKRLQSFHTENILFLQSLNKKTKPVSHDSPVTPTECHSAYSSASVSAANSPMSSPSPLDKKRRKLDFDEVLESPEALNALVEDGGGPENRTKRRTKSRFSSPVAASSSSLELTDLNCNTLGVVKDELNSGPEPVADVPVPHEFNNNGPLPYCVSTLGPSPLQPSVIINTSVPPPPLSNYQSATFSVFGNAGSAAASIPTTTLNSPGVNYPATSSRLLLSELLENAQKIKSYSTEAPAATTNYAGGYASGHGSYLSLNSTPLLSKMTFQSEPPLSSISPSPARTLIRTASADPRLNPSLNSGTETPPAPKRKLSINEYRKRMQQTPTQSADGLCSSGATSPVSSRADRNSISEDLEALQQRRELDRAIEEVDVASPERGEGGEIPVAKVSFSAAPTLLERQQEMITERLKSYKSVTELLTTKDGAPITTLLQGSSLGSSIIESLRMNILSEGRAEEAPAERSRTEDGIVQPPQINDPTHGVATE